MPNKEVSKIISYAEIFLKPKLHIQNVLKPNFLRSSVTKCVQNILLNDYCKLLKYHKEDHRYWIIKSIVEKFIMSRTKRFLKKHNTEKVKQGLRKRLTSIVHFSNN